MEMLQRVWKQHLRPRAVVGYGVKIFLPSPPNYVTRSPGNWNNYCLDSGHSLTVLKFSVFASVMTAELVQLPSYSDFSPTTKDT